MVWPPLPPNVHHIAAALATPDSGLDYACVRENVCRIVRPLGEIRMAAATGRIRHATPPAYRRLQRDLCPLNCPGSEQQGASLRLLNRGRPTGSALDDDLRDTHA